MKTRERLELRRNTLVYLAVLGKSKGEAIKALGTTDKTIDADLRYLGVKYRELLDLARNHSILMRGTDKATRTIINVLESKA
jgi:hypothetical protein